MALLALCLETLELGPTVSITANLGRAILTQLRCEGAFKSMRRQLSTKALERVPVSGIMRRSSLAHSLRLNKGACLKIPDQMHSGRVHTACTLLELEDAAFDPSHGFLLCVRFQCGWRCLLSFAGDLAVGTWNIQAWLRPRARFVIIRAVEVWAA